MSEGGQEIFAVGYVVLVSSYNNSPHFLVPGQGFSFLCFFFETHNPLARAVLSVPAISGSKGC